MNIAVFHELTPLSGARKVVEEYGKILKTDHLIDLYYFDEKEDEKNKGIFNNVYFFKFTERQWKGNNWKNKLYKDNVELVKLFLLHRKIARLINEKQYDFIFVNPSKFTQAPFLLRFLSKKSVYYCQEPLRIVYDNFLNIPKDLSMFKNIYEKMNRAIRKRIDRVNLNKASLVLANSIFSKDNIKNAYGRNAYVCYLGVDADKFKALDLKKEWDIFFLGDKAEIEGFDLLQKAMGLYKNSAKPKVKVVARNDKGNGVSEEELVQQFNKSKIVLALSRNEPFGLTVIEAMSCEVPVIAVNEGGFRESVLDGKTGYLIDRNENELKARIDLLLKNEELRVELGKGGRVHVLSKFTWEKSAGNFLNIVSKNLN
jgi:glycosyltransferase involved in cell wall biosynthesis